MNTVHLFPNPFHARRLVEIAVAVVMALALFAQAC